MFFISRSLKVIISEFKNSMRLAIPLIASEVIVALSSFIATMMVASLGEEQLAANALAWEIYIAVIIFFMGILCSVSVLVAHSFGANDLRSTSICFKQGLIMALLCTPIMMLTMFVAPTVLAWTGQDPGVVAAAEPFFYALAWSMLPVALVFVVQQFLIGIDKARLVTIMSVAIVLVQVGFFYVLLFGKYGFPQLNLPGIGYAVLASNSLVVTIFLGYLYAAKSFQLYQLFNQVWHVHRRFLRELVRVGLPLGVMFGADFALFAGVAIMMGVLGTTALAAYQIANQYLVLSLSFIFALTQVVTVRISSEVGKNNRSSLQLAAITNMVISFGMMLPFSVFYLFYPKLAIGLDLNLNDASLGNLIKEATVFLAMVSAVILVDCIRMISIGALRGLKDTKVPMFISIICFWCMAFPLAYLLAFKWHLGGAGIWLGVIIGLLVTGIILLLRFNRLVKTVDLLSLVTKEE